MIALGAAAAIGVAGRGFAWLLTPLLPRLRERWDCGFNRVVHRFDGLLAPRGRAAQITGLSDPCPPAKSSAPSKPLLSIRGLNKRFGGVVAVDGVDLDVWPGQIVGLIGPNGSGKTTLFNLTSGVYPIDSGSVVLEGKELAGQPPTSIVLGGISRTFQNIRLFSSMTVLENVQTALHTISDYSLLAAFVQWPWTVRAAEKRLRDAQWSCLG